ncbi:MAG: AIR synthase-related protein, partial [Candidatus Heimdallarchaeota archaeon]
LTKPIGIQAIMAAYRILKDFPEMLEQYSKDELKKSINFAIKIMTTSNQDVVKTIHSYSDFSFIHAMSDVTGFGLSGHTKEMLQNSNLSAVLEKIPAIKLSQELSSELGYAFNDCTCHETAGGMLMAVDPVKAEEFSDTLYSNGIKNWIIGTIDSLKPRTVRVDENKEIIEIQNL